mgnify:CR=1 FL=1
MPLVEESKSDLRESIALMNCWGPIQSQYLGIVTKKWKYIYWFYGEGMKPKEELFNLDEDRLELINATKDPQSNESLEEMRSLYDQEIITIKVAGVDYQLHCPKDEQRGLINAADYLNKKIRKIKRQAKFLSIEKASILAGLEVTNELLNSDKIELNDTQDSAEAAKEEIAENSHSEKPQLEERATEPEKKTDDLSIKLVSEISELSKL